MLEVIVANPENGEAVEVFNTDGHPSLSVTDNLKTNGVFKTVTHTVATTTVVSLPPTGGSIILSDLVITTEKKQNGIVLVQFTDGSNTEVIIGSRVNDAPLNLAIAFGGRWRGWRDARLEFITVADFSATLAVGYAKLPVCDTHSVWDKRR